MPPTTFNIYSLPYHRNFPPLPPFLKRKPCWGSALLLVSLPGRTADMANSKLCKCIWFGSKFITRKHHLCLLRLFSSLSFDAVANDDKKMAQKPRHYQFVNWLSLNYHRYVTHLIELFHYIIPKIVHTILPMLSCWRLLNSVVISCEWCRVRACMADVTMTRTPWGALSLLATHADSLIQWLDNTITALQLHAKNHGKF